MIRTFQELFASVKDRTSVPIAVPWPEDPEIIESLLQARSKGLISEIYAAGRIEVIQQLLMYCGGSSQDFTFIAATDELHASSLAVSFVRQEKAAILVKGSLKTDVYLKPILDREKGLRSSAILSNVSLFEMVTYHKFLAISDNALIINPTIEEKKAIIENTKPLWEALAITSPHIGILAATETVTPTMQATIDAASLVMMSKRNQIKGCIIDGPLSYDCLINAECARKKGITSCIAGDVDLIVPPSLEAANILGKSYKFHGNASWGGVLLGGRVPCVLNSRSDDASNRLNSLIIARSLLKQ